MAFFIQQIWSRICFMTTNFLWLFFEETLICLKQRFFEENFIQWSTVLSTYRLLLRFPYDSWDLANRFSSPFSPTWQDDKCWFASHALAKIVIILALFQQICSEECEILKYAQRLAKTIVSIEGYENSINEKKKNSAYK